MMIDFALDAERNEGMAPRDAIYQAALLRFRPILMTTLAALFGALPLMLSTRLRRRAAPAARPRDGRRPARQPGADAVHHAGDLPVLRPSRRAPGGRRRSSVDVKDATGHEPLGAVHRPPGRDHAAESLGRAGRRARVTRCCRCRRCRRSTSRRSRCRHRCPAPVPRRWRRRWRRRSSARSARIAGVNEIDSQSSQGSTRITSSSTSERTSTRPRARCRRPSTRRARCCRAPCRAMPTYRKINPPQAPIMLLALTSNTKTRASCTTWRRRCWRRRSRRSPASAK